MIEIGDYINNKKLSNLYYYYSDYLQVGIRQYIALIYLGNFNGFYSDLFRISFASNRTRSEGDPNKFRRRSEGVSNKIPRKDGHKPADNRRNNEYLKLSLKLIKVIYIIN